MQQRLEDFLPQCSLSTVSLAKEMWGRGLSLKTSVGAGAGAVISPSVFVSSSMMVAVASLALSWVGAIFWLRLRCLSVRRSRDYLYCTVPWAGHRGFERLPGAQIGAALGVGCGKMLQAARRPVPPQEARQARFCRACCLL